MLFTDNQDPIVPPSRHLRIDFYGGPEHQYYDPCSPKDLFAATTRIADGVLDVGVVQSYPAGATPAPSCFIAGSNGPWHLDVDLGQTFTGGAWRDLYGPYLFFMAPPSGLAELTGLPAGWELRDGGNLGASSKGVWARSYSPDPQVSDPSRTLTFIQAFGGPVPGWSAADSSYERQQVKVGDADATLYRDPQSGSLTLVWRLGDDGLALVAPEQYFPVDALVGLAKSAKTP